MMSVIQRRKVARAVRHYWQLCHCERGRALLRLVTRGGTHYIWIDRDGSGSCANDV